LRLGAADVLGMLSLHNRANQRRASLTGDGQLQLGGAGAGGQLSINDSDNNNAVVIRADNELVNVFLGAARQRHPKLM
jgi:hypothetical protein